MIFILLPTYNERENIERIVPAICSLRIPDVQLVVIDDNSPDGTGVVARALSSSFPLDVIHRPARLGIGSAYVEGFRYALDRGAQYVVTMDADFSHDPTVLPHLLAAAKEGNAVVLGSRRVVGGRIVGWRAWRHCISWSATSLSRWVLGLTTRDITSGFRCYRRDVLEMIGCTSIRSSGYSFQVEMIARIEKRGIVVREIPIVFRDRCVGTSKLASFAEGIRFLATLFHLRAR